MRYQCAFGALAAVLLFGSPGWATPVTSGLQLWLDANQGISHTGGVVGSWTGQSPGTAHVFSAPSGQEPTRIPSALNGLPVIRFSKSGVGDVLNNSTLDLGNNKTVFLVISPDALPADTNQRFFGHYSSGQLRYNNGKVSGWFGFSAPLDDTAGIEANKFGILAYRFNNNVEIGLNGRPLTETSASTPAFSTASNLSVGGVGGEAYFGGDFAEVLVYDNPMDAASRSDVDWYLMRKWFDARVRPYTPDAQTAALYHLDETGGTGAADASGNGLDLAASVSPFNGEPGPVGIAAAGGVFSTASRQLARDPSATELANFDTTNFTIEAWVKNPQLNAEHDGVFTYRNGSNNRFQFSILDTNG